MSAYGRRSSKTRRRKLAEPLLLKRRRRERRLKLLLSHSGPPGAPRTARSRVSDALAIRGRRAESGIAGEHGVRNRAPREQLAHARIVPAEARVVGRQRDDDGGDGAERVVELAHQRPDRQARVDRLAPVVICERSERVARGFDVGARRRRCRTGSAPRRRRRPRLRSQRAAPSNRRARRRAAHAALRAASRSGQRVRRRFGERGVTLGLELPERAEQRQRVDARDARRIGAQRIEAPAPRRARDWRSRSRWRRSSALGCRPARLASRATTRALRPVL